MGLFSKNLRNAGLSIESLIEFSTLAQLRDKQNVEDAQKHILKEQLVELDKKLGKCNKQENYLCTR